MQTTIQLLDRAKKAQSIESDYRLAQVLGVSKNAITNYRYGKSCPEDAVAARLAEMAGQDASTVIAELHAERAKTPEVRALWVQMARKLRDATAAKALATAGLALLLIAGAPAPARAAALSPAQGSGSEPVYYVNYHRHLYELTFYSCTLRILLYYLKVRVSRSPCRKKVSLIISCHV